MVKDVAAVGSEGRPASEGLKEAVDQKAASAAKDAGKGVVKVELPPLVPLASLCNIG